MRQTVVAGNWKMNTDRAEAVALARTVREALGASEGAAGVEVGVAPPFPYLPAVAEVLAGSAVWVAGQDLHPEASGAYTGDVSGSMLADVGCTHVILGHSERRHRCGENSELVGRKVGAALAARLVPIVCVGETLAEREAGRTEAVVVEQLSAALADYSMADLSTMILAYEPVWAIGTGLNATSQQAGEVHALLRRWLGGRFDEEFAGSVRIQYGGSVKPGNAAELLAVPDVDGALVGGASLQVESFVGIVTAG